MATATATPLHELSRLGNAAAVSAMLLDGADHNSRVAHPCYSYGMTSLHLAAREGHLEVALALIEAGTKVDDNAGAIAGIDDVKRGRQPRKRDPTPLHEAAAHGRVEVVRALLMEGAPADALTLGVKCHGGGHHRRRDYDISPLHLAAEMGHVDVVKALAEAGAGVNRRSASFELTPLWLAAEEGHVDVVIALLESGADPDLGIVHEDGDGGTPIGWLCANTHVGSSSCHINKVTEMVQALARHGADIAAMGCFDHTEVSGPPLSCAVQNGVTAIVSALLDAGADPNQEDGSRGVLPIHDAARSGSVDMLRLLLRAGADKDARSEFEGGPTPLHLACRFTNVECVCELLRWGVDLWARESIDEEDEEEEIGVDDEEWVIEEGCEGRVPADVIGLQEQWDYNGVGEPCKEEDEELIMESSFAASCVHVREAARKGIRDRNSIRRVLRREASWRRRGPLLLLKTALSKRAAHVTGVEVDTCGSGRVVGGRGGIVDCGDKRTGCVDGVMVHGGGDVRGEHMRNKRVAKRGVRLDGTRVLRGAVQRLIDLAGTEEGLFRHVVVML